MKKHCTSRKVLSLCVALLMAVTMFTACQGPGGTAQSSAPTNSAGSVSEPKGEDRPYVEFDWNLFLTQPTDAQMVIDAINAYIKPILNAKVNLHFMGGTEAASKASVMVSSGQDFGIIDFGVFSQLDYAVQSQNGSFYPLEGLMDKYGPKVKKLFPQAIWDSLTLNGHIYGIPTKKDNCYIMSFVYNKDLATELGLDMSQMKYKNYTSMEKFFTDALAKRDTKYGKLDNLPLVNGGLGEPFPYNLAVESFFTNTFFAVSNIDGINDIAGKDSKTIFNLYETPEFAQLCKFNVRMVNAGVMLEDYEGKGTTLMDDPRVLGGPGWGYTYVPEHLWSQKYTTDMVAPERVWTDMNNFTSCGTSIAANCKNAERAFMLLDLVNTDPKLATMLRFGVEGQHYLLNDKGQMVLEGSPRNNDPAKMGYVIWYGADIGNLLIVKAPESYGGPDGIMLKRIAEYNDKAAIPTHMGLIINLEPIKNEIAACTSVVTEFAPALARGSLGTETKVDETIKSFNDKLYANGLQKILDEVQKQANAFAASKK